MTILSRPPRTTFSRWLLTCFLIATAALLLISIWNITSTTSMGENDFVAYWSSTYLFHHGQNPYDPSLMEMTQKTKLRTGQDVTIMTWNPPTLLVFLLPLAWFSFLQAKFIWLVLNLIMIVTAGLMLGRIYDAPKSTWFTLVLLLFTLVFPPIVSGLYMGQVTFLVLVGLVTALWLIKREAWFGAGLFLIFTTIKPHLVILSLIYLLFHMALQRKYKGWIGLIVSGLICALVLFLFRPSWVNDLVGLSAMAPVNWATPTIGGLLSSLGITEFARYLIVVFLPLPIWLALNHAKFSVEFSVAVLTLITIPVTFFGWNYDQSMLVIPISLVFVRLAKSQNTPLKLFVVFMILASLGVNIHQRIVSSNDLLYVWVPLLWWFLFALTWRLHPPQTSPHEQTIL